MLIGRVVAHVRANGGDADALIARFDLPVTVEIDPISTIRIDHLHTMLEEAAEALGDPFLGIHIAERGPTLAPRLLQFVCSGVEDLGAMLERYVRYAALLSEPMPLSVERSGGMVRVKLRVLGEPFCLGRHGNEHWVGTLLASAREATGASITPSRVWLAHPLPKDTSELARVLGTSQIEQGDGFNGVEVPEAVLATKLRGDRLKLSPLLARYAAIAAAERPSAGFFDGRVRDAIRARLASGAPSIGVIARALGTSARTLQRRLGEDGLSFHGLVDALREDLARRYAEGSELTIIEMAAKLGYAQPSAFLRAFKRWTGTTPKALRAKEDAK